MADGILCKHCGHCETDHLINDDEEENLKRLVEGSVEAPKEKVTGYEVSLTDCSGYDPEDPELAHELIEQQARQKIYGAKNRSLLGN